MELETSLLVMGPHKVNSIYKLLSPWFGMPGTKISKRETIFVSPERSIPIFEVQSEELFNQNSYKTPPTKAYLLSHGSLMSDCHYCVLLAHFPPPLAVSILLLLVRFFSLNE